MITAKTFLNTENARIRRTVRHKVKLIRKNVEGQLRKKLAKVKSGSLKRCNVFASVNVYGGAVFPLDYEKELNNRGFVVIPREKFNSSNNYQTYHIVIKGFEETYLGTDFDLYE